MYISFYGKLKDKFDRIASGHREGKWSRTHGLLGIPHFYFYRQTK